MHNNQRKVFEMLIPPLPMGEGTSKMLAIIKIPLLRGVAPV
ncbi:MAG: hypothetical protein PHX30_03140 [Candidatus Pacebacteria bacterium]|nr:hypothetical protein [Candidatus Paceibacterota bacterium]